MGFIQVSVIANDVNSCCLQGNLEEMIFVKASQMKIKMICCLVDEYISVFILSWYQNNELVIIRIDLPIYYGICNSSTV